MKAVYIERPGPTWRIRRRFCWWPISFECDLRCPHCEEETGRLHRFSCASGQTGLVDEGREVTTYWMCFIRVLERRVTGSLSGCQWWEVIRLAKPTEEDRTW